jgi:hypothetical protein
MHRQPAVVARLWTDVPLFSDPRWKLHRTHSKRLRFRQYRGGLNSPAPTLYSAEQSVRNNAVVHQHKRSD